MSFSRKDSRVTRWLQRRLEWFHFPVKLDSCGQPLQLNPFLVDGRERDG